MSYKLTPKGKKVSTSKLLLTKLKRMPMTFGQMQSFVFRLSKNYDIWKANGKGDKAPQGYWCVGFNFLKYKSKVIIKDESTNLYHLTPIGESIQRPMSMKEAQSYAYWWEDVARRKDETIANLYERESILRETIEDFLEVDPMTLSPNDYRHFLELIKKDLIYSSYGRKRAFLNV
jgi:hypothetical protein